MSMASAHPTRHVTPKPFHLFVYGTLMSPSVFRAVLGLRLVHHEETADGVDNVYACDAVLPAYKKVSPDGTYLYAVPDPHGRIHGYVAGPLPGECLAALRRYEGSNYRLLRVKVLTAEGPVRAVVFVGREEQFSHAFGWRFRDHLKQELLLRGKIDKALREDEITRLHTNEEITRRALSEFHGRTIRDLVRHHFDAGGISTFAIHQAIRDEPLREFSKDMSTDVDARLFAPAYLAMVVRQVMFNQIEDRVRDEFRYNLDRMGTQEKFYDRTISALAAMRLLNAQAELMHLLTGDVLSELPLASHRLIDYVRWAVVAADATYDPAAAGREIRSIREHMGGGHIPLGAELEFSNIGHDVILDPAARRVRDSRYDGFLYFRDFALDILTWKLGGHVDDHRVKSSSERRRGFFELAFGSLSVEENISKPITDDPWLLNQMTHAAMKFYDIAPHSLHVSLQLRSPNRPVQDRPLPLSVMKCLFALTGDPAPAAEGGVCITRLCGEEIIRKKPTMQMLFTQISRRRSVEEDSDVPGFRGRWVQQFKFLRLSPTLNYEPIIMALKGLQIHFKPGSFLTGEQYRTKPVLARMFDDLVRWGRRTQPLAEEAIEQFLSAAHEGLMREHRGRPAHRPAYIAYCLARLREDLGKFNDFVRKHTPPAGGRGPD